LNLIYSNSPSNVYWITGLAGSGKTTIGFEFYNFIKVIHSNTVFIDGDILREVLGEKGGTSLEERYKLSMYYSKLCKMLADQGIHVVCCTISMFDSIREWNRKNIHNYHEIYLKVPLDILHKRDKKGLYSGAVSGEIKNVIGVDVVFEEPKIPNLIIDNKGAMSVEDTVNCLKEYYVKVNK